MKKIIMFEGDIETQGYFSRQMKAALEALGHEVYLYELREVWKSTSEMMAFIEKGNTVLLSFNFHGFCQEAQFLDENGQYIWDGLLIPVCNILADHPYYYYNLLSQRPQKYYQLSIDLGHERFMKRFFPNVALGPFMPLGGTRLYGGVRAGEREQCKEDWLIRNCSSQAKPIRDRKIDVLFTGNYASPKRFEKYITRLGDEYTAFYYEMIHDLLAHPNQTVEEVVERYIRREIPEVTEEELKETMQNITFIDLFIRYTVRGEVIKALIENGIRVHVFGDKWDELETTHRENLIDGDSLYSEECLAYTCESKVCINVLPWFQDGPHDRVFNTMLNGACLLTDTNVWLDDFLVDEENCRIFDLQHLERLPKIVKQMLADDNKLQRMADAGMEAAKKHTWDKRMEVFHEWVESI